jgi:branched-chain amino acid transport system substrate-binding protein
MTNRFSFHFGAAALLVGMVMVAGPTRAADTIKLGMLTDQSSTYATAGGIGTIAAAKLAIEDFGGKVLGKPIELLTADHKNRPDIGSQIARGWIDVENVDGFIEVQTSSVSLAVLDLAKQANKAILFSSSGTLDLTTRFCSDVSIAWTWDNFALAKVVSTPLTGKGLKSWFLIAPDYTFGLAVERDTRSLVEQQGGVVVGSTKTSLNNQDYSSAVLQAKSSKAQVIAAALAGADAVNFMKTVAEFGMSHGPQTIALLSATVNDVDAMGLEAAQGLQLVEAFYWDMNDETRAWSKRYTAATGVVPNMFVAGAYSATLHYLRAVQAIGTTDGRAVVAQMKRMPVNDFMTKNGRIREDGRLLRDMYLFQVKTPQESKFQYDYYQLVATVPGPDAFLPASLSSCPLLAKVPAPGEAGTKALP